MRIDGEWYACDDGVVRPVIRGGISNAFGLWEAIPLLLDTGADCTVISSGIVDLLGFDVTKDGPPLGGVGGRVASIKIQTQIRLPYDRDLMAIFRGSYSATKDPEMLDMSVLGRDITNLFSVIVDRPGNVVALIRPRHRYVVHSS
jgi:hypothetical protein